MSNIMPDHVKNIHCITTSDLLLYFFFAFIFQVTQNKIQAQSTPNLIIVQVPAIRISASDQNKLIYSPMDRYVENSRIIKFSPISDQHINLTPGYYAAADPDVSFDGETIIFAGKKNVEDRWQIWRMKHDGSEKTQITQGEGDCFMPVHVGNRFYLNDPQPTPQIIYAGTAHNWRNLREKWPVLSLYGTDPEGKTTHRLTFNLYSDFSPDVLPYGRIVYSSWQVSWQGSRTGGKYAFMGINNDGTDLMPYYGNHESPHYKDMIHVSDTDHRVYYIESDYSHWLGGGDIALLSQQRPLHSYKKLSRAGEGLYHSPCPNPDGSLLSSYRTNSTDDVFALYRIDPETGKKEQQIYKEPGWHSIDVQVLTAHPEVKGRSNWLIPGSVNGVFYCLDSYMTNISDNKKIESGSIKYLRVMEGIPLSEEDISSKAQAESTNSGMKLLSPRRILGVAPVEKDGSFHIRVPAETPINFQLLDEKYMTVNRQEAWTWVIGNENRGCIGCHEDRELSPPNILVNAVTKPAVDLTLSSMNTRTVDFRQQIAPIINVKCATAQCHVTGIAHPNFENRQDSTDHISSRLAFDTLVKPTDENKDMRYVYPGNAKESPLIWFLFGKKMSSKHGKYRKDINPMPPDKFLTKEERTLFIEWIDTGAYWDLSSLKFLSSYRK